MKSIKIIALLLPLTFVWSWAGCLLLCSELTDRQPLETASSAGQSNGLSAPDCDGCPIVSSEAVLDTRQTIHAPAPIGAHTVGQDRRECLFVPTSIFEADLNQNSPPPDSWGPPLFLRHRAFRI